MWTWALIGAIYLGPVLLANLLMRCPIVPKRMSIETNMLPKSVENIMVLEIEDFMLFLLRQNLGCDLVPVPVVITELNWKYRWRI